MGTMGTETAAGYERGTHGIEAIVTAVLTSRDK